MFSFSEGDCNTQEKLKTVVKKNLGRGREGSKQGAL